MATEKSTASVAETLEQLQSSAAGLNQTEAEKRLQQYGPNALQEKKISPLRRLFGYFWGPIPWMIEVAALLSLLVQHWADFTIIMLLLCFNPAIGFWQMYCVRLPWLPRPRDTWWG